jgi:hypothetical protein
MPSNLNHSSELGRLATISLCSQPLNGFSETEARTTHPHSGVKEMRAARKLSGAFIMAGLVAAGLVISVQPAAAEPMGSYKGQTMFCSAIRTAASSVPSATASDILWALYEANCG